ncbi:hypothetical protein ACTFSJ_24385 [Bacillus cereus group sp. MYBK12-2]|uniref:Uncharacterized protein n=4 Tax=Bacillus cereus group TaxID=86661 RepID=A0A1C4DM36_BACCE|nr:MULTISPECIES: hypothetical protein [Bacillus cereus group]EJR42897.1 hypothetical protein IIK_05414 [Bacillus cereus VD102]KMP90324.1 hypothetical protein TU63_04845 [Bacillus cereus]KXY22454.1 hypothetical protein AT273_08065 [Bacillus cereus]MCC2340456.1 hypothetical protein [Bacillus tropicus]MCC2456476.1 hypothetical protein [Bacillus cereus]
MKSLKDLFKRNTRPQFPIQDTKALSSKEVDYLILDLRIKNDDRKKLDLPKPVKEFGDLITEKLVNNLMYGIQFSELEIKILNGFYHDVDVSFIEFLLLTDLIQYEEPNKVIGDLQTQGYSYIEGIGYLRFRNYYETN